MLGVEDIMSIEKTKINRKEITNCITISAISYLVHKRVSCFREIRVKPLGSLKSEKVEEDLSKTSFNNSQTKQANTKKI